MPYIKRNEAGQICGYFTAPQDGVPEEWLDDGAAELVAYQNYIPPAPAVSPVDKLAAFLKANPDVEALLK